MFCISYLFAENAPKYGEKWDSVLASFGSGSEAFAKDFAFLCEHMSESDRSTLEVEQVLQNVGLSQLVRLEMPWGELIPEEIYQNNVLPYACLDEPRDPWREDFYRRFSKMLREHKVTTAREAVRVINANIARELKVEYNVKRKRANQSPKESMEIGMASCTGLSILLVDAFRSVGIPARIGGTPAWTTKEGNHNWVEVWLPDDKQWHFTEYYPNEKGLDHSWLLKDAGAANTKSAVHSIYASSWERQGVHFPLAWDLENRDVAAENVTQRYVALARERGLLDERGLELRIEDVVEKRRRVTEVAVYQGDQLMGKGKTPDDRRDRNEFFTLTLQHDQLYTVIWETEAGRQHTRIKMPAKQALEINLSALETQTK